MTRITYDDSPAGRFRMRVEGHAVRVNPEDDHNVICACVSTVVTGLLSALPDHLLDEAVEDADGRGLTIETDGNYVRIEPGFAEFDVTADSGEADYFYGAFEVALRCFERIAREWSGRVELEY